MIVNRFRDWRSRFGLDSPLSTNLREGLQWLLMARLVVLGSILTVVLLQQIYDRSLVHSPFSLALFMLVVGFVFNLVQSAWLKSLPQHWLVAAGNIVFDAALISAWLVYPSVQDGKLYALFYLVQILVVSLVFYQRGAFLASGLSIVSFGLVCLFRETTDGWIIWSVYSVLFLLLGLVGGYLSEELMKTTRSLEEKSRAHALLRRFHEHIISFMPTGLITVDSEMKVSFINEAGEHILGINRENVMGLSLAEVEPGLTPFFTTIESEDIEDEEPGAEEDSETQLSATGTHLRRKFFTHPKSDDKGTIRLQQSVEIGSGAQIKILRGDVATLPHDEGEISQVEGSGGGARVLLFQDVTKLQHIEDKLRQNEKLAAVGQLAAGIAHEIRNPLAGISGSIEMLKTTDSDPRDPENQRLMDIAIREIDRLNGLISEFLDFVKPYQFKFEPVSLDELLDEIAGTLSHQEPFQTGRVAIRKELRAKTVAHANRKKLTQVIWNLGVNALQSMDKEGSLTFGCDRSNNQWVRFWVSDTGKGMSEEVQTHLYEPFFTTKEKGTGLGLATAYKIIEAHHGEIRVTSEVDKGTTFEILLPSA